MKKKYSDAVCEPTQNYRPMRLDAAESAFFKRQLEYVKRTTYDQKNKIQRAFVLIPLSFEAGPGASEITYRSFRGVGRAKIISDYATDFPRVDELGVENTVKVKDVGASFGYSIREIRASQLAGKNLNTARAMRADQAVMEEIDDIAWSGNTEHNIQGLIDYPGITEYTVPAGASTLKTWASKTPDEIVADINGIITEGVMDTTNGIEIPDTLILPIKQYNLLVTTRMTGNSDKTILAFVLENNPYLKNVEWVTELKGVGAGATDRMMVYPKDPNNLTLEIPSQPEQLDVEQKGAEFSVPVMGSTAGVIVYYPLSVAYADGI